MLRACPVSLKFATASKLTKVQHLLNAYRRAVNFYIHEAWRGAKLDKETLARLESTSLSERFKSQALRQALSIVITTKKSAKALGKPCSMPVFKGGAKLDAKFVNIEQGQSSFDLIVRLSTLERGYRITIPTRSTKILNDWLNKPGAKLIQGCELCNDKIILWVDVPEKEPKEGLTLGLDLGVNKLFVLSDGRMYGTDFKSIRDRLTRAEKGSANKKQLYQLRDTYIRECINQLPWDELSTLVIEDLKYIKHKKKKKGRRFNRAMAPWIVGKVREWLQHKAQENRVRLVVVAPEYTSQTCPHCGTVSRNNRRLEVFCCINCGYSNDADIVGAMNVLSRATVAGEPRVPQAQKAETGGRCDK